MHYQVEGGEMSQQEAETYIRMICEKHPEQMIKDVVFRLDGDYVDVSYTYDTVPFDRVRRITGYLVGTLERFNDAKWQEEAQRVKHNI